MNIYFLAQPPSENPEVGSIYQPGVGALAPTLGIRPQTLRPICPAPAGRRESFQDERSSLWAMETPLKSKILILTKFK
jgi:hypothetical protein